MRGFLRHPIPERRPKAVRHSLDLHAAKHGSKGHVRERLAIDIGEDQINVRIPARRSEKRERA